MQVTINGKIHRFEDHLTIEQILRDLKIPTEHGIAVALNDTVISRRHFSDTPVKDGDRLEVVHAVAGG